MELGEGRGAVLIAIDTDSNEDASLIREAWSDRGLTEPVAISPQRMTEQLVSQFGPDIVTPPTAPIIIINAEQTSAELLPRGRKIVSELNEAIEKAR